MVEQQIAMDYRDRAECRIRLIPYFYDAGGGDELFRLCQESIDLFSRCCLMSKGVYVMQREVRGLFMVYRHRFPELSDQDISFIDEVHDFFAKADSTTIHQAVDYVCRAKLIVDKCLRAVGGWD